MHTRFFSFNALMFSGLLMLSSYSAIAQTNTLKPFVTDGCSVWIDGTHERPNLWRSCCVVHDKAYWLGGGEELRRQADDQFKLCIAERMGKGMAEYMYVNVLWGGSPYWLTPYRWGYGWNYLEDGKPRGYKTPSEEDQQQIDALLPAAEQTILNDAVKHPVDESRALKK